MQVAYEPFLYMYKFKPMRFNDDVPLCQLVLVGDPQELLGVVDANFSKDVLPMDTNGLLGDEQGLGNLPIAQAGHDLAQHLHFPLGQFEPKMEEVPEPGFQSGAHLTGLVSW